MPSEVTTASDVVLSDSLDVQKWLSAKLLDSFCALKTWGKEPEQLAAIDRDFREVLADYSQKDIEKAFLFYRQKISGDLPTSFDIASIIGS